MSLKKKSQVLFIALLLIAPAFLFTNINIAFAASKARNPTEIATTLAFKDGQVVTVQYSNIYFCNSAGPATSATDSPCKVNLDAVVDPVPDVASNLLDVIVPLFDGLGSATPNTLTSSGLPGSGSIFDPTLGMNVFSQCPDNTSFLTCPNHPNYLDLAPLGLGGVYPLPIHTHILSGNGGGWWKLRVWLVTNPNLWPNPSTGTCTASAGCLTSLSALTAAAPGAFFGPTPILTTIYLFFNVVSSNSK